MAAVRWVPVRTIVLCLAAALLATTPVPPAQAQDGGGSVAIVKDDELPSNAELAVRLSEATPLPAVSRVVISRDDDFADALASGVLQDTSPLLLVPRNGPVPDRVLNEIRRVGAGSAVILGGTSAVAPQVEQQLAGAGLAVQRRQGGSRFETAVEIARNEAPEATTAILARAFPADPGNPTQGFADALASGAMAADNHWPILLSDTGQLNPVTRSYLEQSAVERVLIVGGTAAISSAVEQEIRSMVGTTERIAGDSRAGTAVEIAKERGTESAADAARVVLVDGTSPNGFAGGFAAAAHAAFYDAPVLLVDGIQVPPETEEFLAPGAAFAQTSDALTVTCVVHPLACDGGRETLGLVDFPLLEVTPPINSLVAPGQLVTLRLGPPEEGRDQPITVKGSCLDGQQELTTDATGRATVTLSGSLGQFCGIDVTYGRQPDAIQQGFSYTTDPTAQRGSGIAISSEVFTYGSTTTSTPVYVNDEIACTGTEPRQDSAYEATYLHPDQTTQSFSLSSFPVDVQPGGTCTATAEVPAGITDVLWGVYNWSDSGLRNPLVLGRGRTAEFAFDQLGSEQLDGPVTDVEVVWILRTDTPEIGVPAATGPGTPGQVFNAEGLPVVCDGQPIGDGLTVLTPGTTCDVTVTVPGLGLLVVEPGRPLTPATQASVAVRASQEPVAVYTIVTDQLSGGGGQGCDGAPAVGLASLVTGTTSAVAPAGFHTIAGTAGQQLRIRADRTGEEPLDPVLNLYGPDGSLVDSNDDGDSFFNSRVDVTLPVDGTYCVEVTGFSGSTGDYLLAVDPAPVFIDSGEFTAAMPEDGYTYSGTAGSLLVMELRALGFASTDPVLELYTADGTLVAADDDGGGVPNSRLVVEVPVTGDYLIRATVFGEAYGQFLFEASFPTGS